MHPVLHVLQLTSEGFPAWPDSASLWTANCARKPNGVPQLWCVYPFALLTAVHLRCARRTLLPDACPRAASTSRLLCDVKDCVLFRALMLECVLRRVYLCSFWFCDCLLYELCEKNFVCMSGPSVFGRKKKWPSIVLFACCIYCASVFFFFNLNISPPLTKACHRQAL